MLGYLTKHHNVWLQFDTLKIYKILGVYLSYEHCMVMATVTESKC